MIPVDQTIFDPPTGNCFAACVASLMERPLWTVPNFVVRLSTHKVFGKDWYEKFGDWVCGEGWAVVTVHAPIDVGFGFRAPKGTLSIATGLSPRAGDFPDYPNMQHCVVQDAVTGTIVHDPHPSGAGIIGDPSCWEILWRPER